MGTERTAFAAYLDDWIARLDLSQRAAAEVLGVSHTQVARYLEGAVPKLDVALRLADALGVTLDELAGRPPATTARPLDDAAAVRALLEAALRVHREQTEGRGDAAPGG